MFDHNFSEFIVQISQFRYTFFFTLYRKICTFQVANGSERFTTIPVVISAVIGVRLGLYARHRHIPRCPGDGLPPLLGFVKKDKEKRTTKANPHGEKIP